MFGPWVSLPSVSGANVVSIDRLALGLEVIEMEGILVPFSATVRTAVADRVRAMLLNRGQ